MGDADIMSAKTDTTSALSFMRFEGSIFASRFKRLAAASKQRGWRIAMSVFFATLPMQSRHSQGLRYMSL
jgi:hypothetical protein